VQLAAHYHDLPTAFMEHHGVGQFHSMCRGLDAGKTCARRDLWRFKKPFEAVVDFVVQERQVEHNSMVDSALPEGDATADIQPQPVETDAGE
jgi:hypothetical protein